MNLPKLQSPKLNLNRNIGGPPFEVDMERFFEFSFWIAEELLDLVAEHKPTFENFQTVPSSDDIRLSKSERFSTFVD